MKPRPVPSGLPATLLIGFPPAFCGGLIEAYLSVIGVSLVRLHEFPPAFCGGLIEACPRSPKFPKVERKFPPAFCGGLIEARSPG